MIEPAPSPFFAEHEALIEAASLTDEEVGNLAREYVDLDRRLEKDGFEESTRLDVLASLVFARTAPRDLAEAAETLERWIPDRDLEAFATAGPRTDSPVRRSIRMLVYNRLLRARDGRLRAWFDEHEVSDREVMMAATLEALFRHVSGRPVDGDLLVAQARKRVG